MRSVKLPQDVQHAIHPSIAFPINRAEGQRTPTIACNLVEIIKGPGDLDAEDRDPGSNITLRVRKIYHPRDFLIPSRQNQPQDDSSQRLRGLEGPRLHVIRTQLAARALEMHLG
jgi:hypothetical protein